MALKQIGGIENLGLIMEGGGGSITPEELRAMGYLRIHQLERHDYDGGLSYEFEEAPIMFIRIYATDNRTSLYELMPSDYTINGKTVTINDPSYLPGAGWYLEGIYTY